MLNYAFQKRNSTQVRSWKNWYRLMVTSYALIAENRIKGNIQQSDISNLSAGRLHNFNVACVSWNLNVPIHSSHTCTLNTKLFPLKTWIFWVMNIFLYLRGCEALIWVVRKIYNKIVPLIIQFFFIVKAVQVDRYMRSLSWLFVTRFFVLFEF